MRKTILIICLLFMGCKFQGHFESKPVPESVIEDSPGTHEEDEIFSNTGTVNAFESNVTFTHYCDTYNKEYTLILKEPERFNITTKPNGDMVFECKE